MKKKNILALLIILIVVIIICILINLKRNNKLKNDKPTNIINTTKITQNNINDLTALNPINNFVANNLKIYIENNSIYLNINDIKYDLQINNIIKMFTVKQKMSSFYNIYFLSIDGELYNTSVSTIKDYKDDEFDTIKNNFHLNETNNKILNLYESKDKKIVYEDFNNTYYYLSNNSLY